MLKKKPQQQQQQKKQLSQNNKLSNRFDCHCRRRRRHHGGIQTALILLVTLVIFQLHILKTSHKIIIEEEATAATTTSTATVPAAMLNGNLPLTPPSPQALTVMSDNHTSSSILDIDNFNVTTMISQEEQESAAGVASRDWKIQKQSLLLPKTTMMQQQKKTTPVTIAYAISVTSCDYSNTLSRISVLDGAAVLGHSIHLAHNTTNTSSTYSYDYKLYAFVLRDSVDEQCITILSNILNYNVIIKDSIPFNVTQIKDPNLRQYIEFNGCCGSNEYLKLYAYTLVEHPIVVHLDIDTIVLKPLNELYNHLLSFTSRSQQNHTTILDPKHMQKDRGYTSEDGIANTTFGTSSNTTVPDVTTTTTKSTTGDSTIATDDDFFYFTRDYHQQSKYQKTNPLQFGIQGGFFIIKPNMNIFRTFTSRILNETFIPTSNGGWSNKGYNGFGVMYKYKAFYHMCIVNKMGILILTIS